MSQVLMRTSDGEMNAEAVAQPSEARALFGTGSQTKDDPAVREHDALP